MKEFEGDTHDATQWEKGTKVLAIIHTDPLRPLIRQTIIGEIAALYDHDAAVRVTATKELYMVPFADIESL